MKLKLLVDKQFNSLNSKDHVLIEKQYRCPCKTSKVVFLAELEPVYEVIDEDILCSQCRLIFEIVPNTQASEVVKKDNSYPNPSLFPKRRRNGLKQVSERTKSKKSQ